ncbi:hypothetical protein L210DRAFT_3506551 [Boletus edulis BED1]|uniref:DUF6532 domain-containing protein n=1 Tax=Boletus edulis BED1 TaxID=1328754 RepID=A0AAD4GB94_BOLED|nr:hypothetical protein L210DRAFT_3506551 [Boletus edulis BED1]
MAPTRRSNSSTTASSRPEPSQTTRPARANAGKGGYISQLRKTSEALDRPQCEQAKDLLENEPVNHLAPTPHRPRKKKTGKQRAKATALEDVNSDPLEADSSQIALSGPDGRFGLQPQAPVFVSRQALEEYEKDRVHHRTKDNTVARTGKGGVHSKQNSCNNSHDETTQMDIDDHHERRPEDEDHNSRMDIHARGGLFDFDDQQVEVPRSNGSHPRREDVIRDRNREDRMDTTGDPAPQGDARTQPPCRCPQSQPSQNTARDTAQPHRHVSNARYLQDRVLPSPPLSRSHSNEANENAHHNNDTQANVVRRGDERNDGSSRQLRAGYEVPVPEQEHTANVQGGNHQDDRASRQHLAGYEVLVAQQEHAAPASSLQERAANVQEGNHQNDGPLRQAPVVDSNHTSTGEGLNANTTDHQHTSAPDQPRHRGRYSKNQKDAIQPKPSHIGFYPKLWQQLLEIAKAEMRCALFLHQPFLPDRKTAIKGECYEVLLGIITRYEREQRPVECGYSDRKANMAEMLYDDVTLFRSILKKAVQEAVPSGYALHAPPTAISREARTMFLKDRATQLLQDSEYLLGDVNKQRLQGKKLLFGHPVLKQVCLYVYYSNTSKSLRTFSEFQRSVPKKALALVAAMVHFMLTLYKKHSRDTNPSLSSKELEDTYKKIMHGMDKLATHHSKGYRFEAMLTQWAAEGMYEAAHKYSEPSLT